MLPYLYAEWHYKKNRLNEKPVYYLRAWCQTGKKAFSIRCRLSPKKVKDILQVLKFVRTDYLAEKATGKGQ